MRKYDYDQDRFQKYSSRVKAVIQHIFKENPDTFEDFVEALTDDQKDFLMHMDEFEAAALSFGKKGRDFFALNSDASGLYREMQEKWLENMDDDTGLNKKDHNDVAHQIEDLEFELDSLEQDLNISDDEDVNELQNAVMGAEFTLERAKKILGKIKDITK